MFQHYRRHQHKKLLNLLLNLIHQRHQHPIENLYRLRLLRQHRRRHRRDTVGMSSYCHQQSLGLMCQPHQDTRLTSLPRRHLNRLLRRLKYNHQPRRQWKLLH